jgi:hypothetical protein
VHPRGLSAIEQLPVPIGFSMPAHDCIVLDVDDDAARRCSAAGLVTLNVISTDWPGVDGSGLSLVIVVTVVAWPTTCASMLDVLGPKLPLPAYEATRVCVPTALKAIEQLPVPIAPSMPVQDCMLLELTVTEPVGVPLALVTLNENNTDWPTTDGSGLSPVIVVVVGWTAARFRAW